MLFSLLFQSGFHLRSEPVPKITVNAFGENGIVLAPCGSELSPRLQTLWESLPAQARPFCLLLTNGSPQSIVAAAFIWTWRDALGNPRTHYFRTDDFQGGRALLRPGERALVVPHRIFPESRLVTGRWAGPPSGAGDIARMAEASNVAVSLDAVVLETGELIGPDQSNTAGFLAGRKMAAAWVSQTVLAMLAEGKDPSERLGQIASQTERFGDYFTQWSIDFARMVLRAPDKKAAAERLSSVWFPAVYRKP